MDQGGLPIFFVLGRLNEKYNVFSYLVNSLISTGRGVESERQKDKAKV